jgi:hypothetical protein
MILLATFLLLSCSENPITPNEEDYFQESQDTTELTEEEREIYNVLRQRIGNLAENVYNDTIPPNTTTKDSDSAKIYFRIDISENIKAATSNGLAKTKLDRLSLCNFRLSMVNALTIQLVSIGSGKKDTLNFSFEIVNGICTTSVINVPTGLDYQTLISLWWVKECPWADYTLYDRSFLALDTLNLSTKTSDTLKASFQESKRMRFFIALPKPPGVWTLGKTYNSCIDSVAIPGLYQRDTIFCNYFMGDIRNRVAEMTFACDTGNTVFRFYPDLLTITKDGIVRVEKSRIFPGRIYRPGDEIPLDDAPQHIRY